MSDSKTFMLFVVECLIDASKVFFVFKIYQVTLKVCQKLISLLFLSQYIFGEDLSKTAMQMTNNLCIIEHRLKITSCAEFSY